MKPKRPACQAVVGRRYNHQIPMVQQCQQSGLAFVRGVWLCGTHVNAIGRKDLEVITTLDSMD